MIPNESLSFWTAHEANCGGQFFKIFEMSRDNPENGEDEKKYVRNVRYMFPKTRQDLKNKDHLKTKIQARMLFDLTGYDDDDAAVQNLCDIIDLDSSEYNQEVPVPSQNESKLVKDFLKQKFELLSHCPFCEMNIGFIRMEQHFDICRGFQLKVVYSAGRR